MSDAIIYHAGPNARRMKYGKFLVSRDAGEFIMYLHRDGIWRDSTVNGNGEQTGYFRTKRRAEIAVEQYESTLTAPS